jgi:hypothetical protein
VCSGFCCLNVRRYIQPGAVRGAQSNGNSALRRGRQSYLHVPWWRSIHAGCRWAGSRWRGPHVVRASTRPWPIPWWGWGTCPWRWCHGLLLLLHLRWWGAHLQAYKQAHTIRFLNYMPWYGPDCTSVRQPPHLQSCTRSEGSMCRAVQETPNQQGTNGYGAPTCM